MLLLVLKQSVNFKGVKTVYQAFLLQIPWKIISEHIFGNNNVQDGSFSFKVHQNYAECDGFRTNTYWRYNYIYIYVYNYI